MIVMTIVGVFAVVGLFRILAAVLKAVANVNAARAAKAKRNLHTVTAPLEDEPPTECPTCGTPRVGVARADFQPNGSPYKLAHTEHFACEFGHRWMGPNQTKLVERRLAARAKLRAVIKPTDVLDEPEVNAHAPSGDGEA